MPHIRSYRIMIFLPMASSLSEQAKCIGFRCLMFSCCVSWTAFAGEKDDEGLQFLVDTSVDELPVSLRHCLTFSLCHRQSNFVAA